VRAHTGNATLGGTVSDASGALISGVTVTATNTGTGIVATVITNQAGAYQFASLQTGTYKVIADLNGSRLRLTVMSFWVFPGRCGRISRFSLRKCVSSTRSREGSSMSG
jgi:Carboxypeptidase regulatory-like domain